jgi:hypothetical protein
LYNTSAHSSSAPLTMTTFVLCSYVSVFYGVNEAPTDLTRMESFGDMHDGPSDQSVIHLPLKPSVCRVYSNVLTVCIRKWVSRKDGLLIFTAPAWVDLKVLEGKTTCHQHMGRRTRENQILGGGGSRECLDMSTFGDLL